MANRTSFSSFIAKASGIIFVTLIVLCLKKPAGKTTNQTSAQATHDASQETLRYVEKLEAQIDELKYLTSIDRATNNIAGLEKLAERCDEIEIEANEHKISNMIDKEKIKSIRTILAHHRQALQSSCT